MINILAFLDFCEEPGFLKILLFIQKLLDIIFIIVPIGLIIMLSIDFTKNVINVEESASKTNKVIVQRIIMTIFLFAVPYMVRVFIALIDDVFGKSLNYNSCLDNMNNIGYFENIKEAQEKLENDIKEREKDKNKANAMANQKIKILSISNPSYTPSDAVFVGQRYNLTDDELTQIAALCQQEQSSPEGSSAEASLMANRYELISDKTSTKGSDLVSYIRNAGWWANAGSFMDKRKVNNENKAVVKEVLVLGNRTLPLYIDEHDCFSDINTIITNGKTMTDQNSISNRSNYTSNETEIHNNMSSIYTFYTFPAERSDPFGYTKKSLEKYEKLNSKNNKYT